MTTTNFSKQKELIFVFLGEVRVAAVPKEFDFEDNSQSISFQPSILDLPTGLDASDSFQPRVEDYLCYLFEHFLNVPDITPNDRLFSVGGDSITVIRISSACRSRGILVSPAQVSSTSSSISI